jgi:hypothetical protein
MKIFLISIFSLFVCAFNLQPQEYTPPAGVKLVTVDDYKNNEAEVIKCIEYIENTPIDTDEIKEANAFLLKWVAGSPTVTVVIPSYLVPLTQKNNQLLMNFVGGWTQFALQHPDVKDKFKGNLAGLRSIIHVYSHSKGVTQDDAVEEIVAVEKENKLEDWLQKHIDLK